MYSAQFLLVLVHACTLSSKVYKFSEQDNHTSIKADGLGYLVSQKTLLFQFTQSSASRRDKGCWLSWSIFTKYSSQDQTIILIFKGFPQNTSAQRQQKIV